MTTTTTPADLTWAPLTWAQVEEAMKTLGHPEYRAQNPSTWTLEQVVLVETLYAYNDTMTTGYITPGGIPKRKTIKQAQIDHAVYAPLLGLAQRVIGGNNTTAEVAIRHAWKEATK